MSGRDKTETLLLQYALLKDQCFDLENLVSRVKRDIDVIALEIAEGMVSDGIGSLDTVLFNGMNVRAIKSEDGSFNVNVGDGAEIISVHKFGTKPVFVLLEATVAKGVGEL